MKQPPTPSFFTFLAIFLALSPLSYLYLRGQTQAKENQIRLKVRVVEWRKCTNTATVDCAGLELYRFLMSDGTIRGPFYAIPVPLSHVIDEKWVRQSE